MASKYQGAFPSVYKTIDYRKRMVDEAYRLAYTGRPKEAKYPSGHPTPQFKKVFNKLKGKYKFWSKASSESASCDVDVATVTRSVYDKNMPWGLWKQKKYMNAHPEAYKKIPRSEAQPGDIGHYTKKGIKKKGHTFIIGKGTQVKEGSARHWFFSTTNALKARLSMEGKKSVDVYRVVNRQVYAPLKKGSKGAEVEKWQMFLNWYFKADIEKPEGTKGKIKKLRVDGDFGELTKKRTIKFQNLNRLQPDGVAGKLTINKAKEVKR